MDSALLAFTRRAIEKGISRADVSKALHQAGWAETDITAALNTFATVDFPLAVPRPKPYLSAREVFFYLMLFTALYVSAYNLGGLAFAVIDIFYPDPASSNYGYSLHDAIRWHIASLVVAFPIFLITFRSVTQAIAKDPTKQASRPRKWLTYLTIFLAGMFLAGDLISLIYNFLRGELTVRFVLKILTIALLAGSTLTYFLADIRKDESA